MIALLLIVFLGWFIYTKVPYGDYVIAFVALYMLLRLLGILSFPIVLA